jgi:hypothetical protein
MIESGLALLVQGNAAVSAIAATGGYALGQLPKGTALPSWTHQVIADKADYVLTGEPSLSDGRWQIDCYGNTAAEAVQLAAAVDAVLSGYRGALPDADQTVVQGVFRTNKIDFFDDVARTYRRMLEYQIWPNQ